MPVEADYRARLGYSTALTGKMPESRESQETTAKRFLFEELTEQIIGCFWATKSQLGSGFVEHVYANGLAVMLRTLGLRVEREVPFEVVFHGVVVGRYRADMVVDDRIIVETKCVKAIDPAIRMQTLSYLAASGLKVGLIFNFAGQGEVKRVFGERLAAARQAQRDNAITSP